MSAELRGRGLDRAFKLTTGSLYDVVKTLEGLGWIVARETVQVGARPPRTVYAPTPLGRAEFVRWLDGLLRVPSEEFPVFLSAVTYLGALGPQGADDALRERAERLGKLIGDLRRDHAAALAALAAAGKPRLFVLEAEYALRMQEAELAWVQEIREQIVDGTLAWPKGWPPKDPAANPGTKRPGRVRKGTKR